MASSCSHPTRRSASFVLAVRNSGRKHNKCLPLKIPASDTRQSNARNFPFSQAGWPADRTSIRCSKAQGTPKRLLLLNEQQHFLRSKPPDVLGCLILDVRLPGMSGLKFQSELGRFGIDIRVVFITAYADVSMGVQAMKAGAVSSSASRFENRISSTMYERPSTRTSSIGALCRRSRPSSNTTRR